MPTKRTDEFKRDAVSLVESDIAQKTVSRDPGISESRDLGISKSVLQAWVRDAKFHSRG